jgi:hypothetical protein
MASEKYLGKISSVRFGHGGYQEACIGLSLQFSFDSSGIGCFKGAWSPSIIKCDTYSKWTEEDRDKQLVEMIRSVDEILHKAKVDEVYKLKGIPVEVEIENQTLKSWRVLEEVL